MADNSEQKPIDKRLADRYLKRGLLDEKVHEKYIKSLPDAADKAVPVETAMTDEDDIDDDEDETGEESGPQA